MGKTFTFSLLSCFLYLAVYATDAPNPRTSTDKKELSFFSVQSSQANFTSGVINTTISEATSAGTSSTLIASGIPLGATIDSVVVSFSINHNWLEDLIINLQAPDGDVLNLVNRRGESSTGGFLNTRISSKAGEPSLPGGFYGSPLTGTYSADAASNVTLALGQTPAVTTQVYADLFTTANGNWTLRIYDEVDDLDAGTLVSWSLRIYYSLATLPVSITRFSGVHENGINRLKWTTSMESANLGFEIEKSQDGNDFYKVGFVESLAPDGNSDNPLQYNYQDPSLNEKVFYRLKQTDQDGKWKYSNVIMIHPDSRKNQITRLFPVPATEQINAFIFVDVPGFQQVAITNMNGVVVKQERNYLEKGANTLSLNIQTLSSGNYIFSIRNNEGQVFSRFFIKE